jgi:putative transcriptional regulator
MAQAAFEQTPLGQPVDSLDQSSMIFDNDLLSMMDSITTQVVEEEPVRPKTIRQIEVAGLRLPLPRAMSSIGLKDWQGVGKLSRSRLELADKNLKASLLYIDKGGSIPSHTHKGYEITLLLQGSFSDEMGSYHEGDFLWLDGEHTHHPVTEEGCVCLTVSSDAIHFTQGMSQLFNPIGKFIY